MILFNANLNLTNTGTARVLRVSMHIYIYVNIKATYLVGNWCSFVSDYFESSESEQANFRMPAEVRYNLYALPTAFLTET